jgi:hypothetical protein
MTTREQHLVQALLEAAHDGDGAQFTETQLHAVAGLKLQALSRLAPTLLEFNAALKIAADRGWLNGVPSRLNPNLRKWNLTDAGEAARLEF